MKKFAIITAVSVLVSLLSGCGVAWQSVVYSDDLYLVHNKTAIANRQKAEAELAKAQYEAQQAQYEATLAKIRAEAAKQGVTVAEGDSSTVNGFDMVLADSYESAYARRLYAFSSPTYQMPDSYYTLRYSDAFHYASAYDPALYNIMVSGDMVWVEPKYITSMFGTWGAVAVPSYSWYYGWNDPFYYWNRPYNWRMNWYWGPSYYWGYPYYWGWGNHHHHHHYPHRPHRPPYHRPPHNNPPHHNPPHAGSGGVGNTGHHQNRPGMVVGRNPGASKPSDRVGSTRPSQPSAGRGTTPTYRGGSSSGSSGSSSYRGGSNSGSSSSRGSGSSNSSGGSSSYRGGSSYNSGSSYSGGSRSYGGSYSGGTSHSSSSFSGGNARGR